MSGSRATVMKSSSSVALPCSAGQGLRIALEQNAAVRKKQHAVADLLDFVHIVRGPEHAACAARAKRRIRPRMSCAVAGSSEAVGSSSSSSCGRFSIALASATRVCSPDDSTPHFVIAETLEVELLEQLLDARREVADA